MTTDPTPDARLELQMALAEADADAPPDHLRASVLNAALRQRSAGSAAPPVEVIDAVEGYRRTVEAFTTLLGQLDPTAWRRPALRDLDVQGLVGHLIGVERDFQAALALALAAAGGPDAPAADARAADARAAAGGPDARAGDHVGSTEASARAQAGRSPADTRAEWEAAAATSLDRLRDQPDAFLDEPMTLHGLTLPVRSMIIVRAFELWTHDEDIRRATGHGLVAPEAGRLALMTGLALPLLPAGMSRVGISHRGRRARIVLTGPGGRTWDSEPDHLGSGSGTLDARIVVDATTFCRVVADRIDPAGCGAHIDGDPGFAHDILVGAAALALD